MSGYTKAGRPRYIASVALAAPAGEPEPLKQPAKVFERAMVTGVEEWANVREQPSTEAEIVGRVSLHERIELLA